MRCDPKDKRPHFEAILETHAVHNTPRKSRLLTIRLDGSAPGRCLARLLAAERTQAGNFDTPGVNGSA